MIRQSSELGQRHSVAVQKDKWEGTGAWPGIHGNDSEGECVSGQILVEIRRRNQWNGPQGHKGSFLHVDLSYSIQVGGECMC